MMESPPSHDEAAKKILNVKNRAKNIRPKKIPARKNFGIKDPVYILHCKISRLKKIPVVRENLPKRFQRQV